MSKPAHIGVVIDANTLLQAVVTETGPAAACLRLAENGHINLFVSRATLAEISEVLERPEIQRRFRSLTSETVSEFMERLRRIAKLIRRVPKRFAYPRDVDDECYINLAIAAKTQYIISRDNDLLDLMTGHSRECKEFRQRFRPLRVIEPQAFLKTRHRINKRFLAGHRSLVVRSELRMLLAPHEVSNLKLFADLVVLNACRTGLGKEVRGEGLIGLTRGFMYAGAARMLVSLWSLEDRSAGELMKRMYGKMLGPKHLSPAAALRRSDRGVEATRLALALLLGGLFASRRMEVTAARKQPNHLIEESSLLTELECCVSITSPTQESAGSLPLVLLESVLMNHRRLTTTGRTL